MFGWLKRRKEDPDRFLKEVLDLDELPTFPVVVLEAMRMLRNPNVGFGQVADQIVRDPGISARLLKLANSPAYALRHRVRNVHHAVSLLGRSEVEALLLSVGVQSGLPRKVKGVPSARFWRTAAIRASVARGFAAELHPATRSEAFTAALLQDMAVPLIARTHGDQYAPVLTEWREGGESLQRLERDVFGWDHALVAGALAERWGFPEALASMIGDHHADDSHVPPAVRLVSLVRENDEGAALDELVATAGGAYGLAPDRVTQIVEQGMLEAEEIASSLGS